MNSSDLREALVRLRADLADVVLDVRAAAERERVLQAADAAVCAAERAEGAESRANSSARAWNALGYARALVRTLTR